MSDVSNDIANSAYNGDDPRNASVASTAANTVRGQVKDNFDNLSFREAGGLGTKLTIGGIAGGILGGGLATGTLGSMASLAGTAATWLVGAAVAASPVLIGLGAAAATVWAIGKISKGAKKVGSSLLSQFDTAIGSPFHKARLAEKHDIKNSISPENQRLLRTFRDDLPTLREAVLQRKMLHMQLTQSMDEQLDLFGIDQANLTPKLRAELTSAFRRKMDQGVRKLFTALGEKKTDSRQTQSYMKETRNRLNGQFSRTARRIIERA